MVPFVSREPLRSKSISQNCQFFQTQIFLHVLDSSVNVSTNKKNLNTWGYSRQAAVEYDKIYDDSTCRLPALSYQTTKNTHTKILNKHQKNLYKFVEGSSKAQWCAVDQLNVLKQIYSSKNGASKKRYRWALCVCLTTKYQTKISNYRGFAYVYTLSSLVKTKCAVSLYTEHKTSTTTT